MAKRGRPTKIDAAKRASELRQSIETHINNRVAPDVAHSGMHAWLSGFICGFCPGMNAVEGRDIASRIMREFQERMK